MKARDLERKKTLRIDALYTWKINARLSKGYRHLIEERAAKLMTNAFKGWKKHARLREEKKRNYVLIARSHLKLIFEMSDIAEDRSVSQRVYLASSIYCV